MEQKDKDGHRSGDKDRDRNRDRSKKSNSCRVTEQSNGRSPLCRDHGGDHTSNGKYERLHMGRTVHPIAVKASRDTKEAPVLHATIRGHTPLRVDLCCLRPCSIPLLYRRCADCLRISRNPVLHICPSIKVGARFLPSTVGGGDARPIYSTNAPVQGGAPSIVGPSLPSTSIATVNFSEDHIKQIFSLTCKGQHLKERIMWEFVRLSSQEVLFRTQAQSTSHESLASRHPDCFTTYYEILRSGQQSSEAKNKAMEEILDQASKVWLATNAMLFKHVLDYETKLEKILNKTGGWIREQEECIWMKMFEITGEAGTPLCAGLDLMLHLLDTLPSFLVNLSYQSNSPIICGFVPETYAQPWLGLHGMDLACLPSFENCKKAKDVLREAIIQSTGGGTVSRASAGPSASTEPTQIEKYTNATPLTSSSAVHSPSKCRYTRSPSPQRLWSDSSSDEESASGYESKSSHSSSSSSSRSSSGSVSGSGSHEGSPAGSEASTGVRSACSQSAFVGSVSPFWRGQCR